MLWKLIYLYMNYVRDLNVNELWMVMCLNNDYYAWIYFREAATEIGLLWEWTQIL